mgnify:CR=1 FL=1
MLLFFSCNYRNFDKQLFPGQRGLHTGPGGGVPLRHPGVPHGVHAHEVRRDVFQVDGGRQDMLPVTSCCFQQAVHFGQHVLCLLRDICGGGVVCNLATQVDGVVVFHNAAHALEGFDTRDRARKLSAQYSVHGDTGGCCVSLLLLVGFLSQTVNCKIITRTGQ